MHGGPWYAPPTHPRYRLKVAGAQRASYGEEVCTSGAMTGEHCGLEVTSPYTARPCAGPGTGAPYCYGFSAENLGSPNAVSNGSGDSGGPVYLFRSDGRVGARGIIYGAHTQVPCGSTAKANVRCGHGVFFTDIIDVKNQWGVSIDVTP